MSDNPSNDDTARQVAGPCPSCLARGFDKVLGFTAIGNMFDGCLFCVNDDDACQYKGTCLRCKAEYTRTVRSSKYFCEHCRRLKSTKKLCKHDRVNDIGYDIAYCLDCPADNRDQI